MGTQSDSARVRTDGSREGCLRRDTGTGLEGCCQKERGTLIPGGERGRESHRGVCWGTLEWLHYS